MGGPFEQIDPIAKVQATIDNTAEQERQIQDKNLEDNFNKINDQITNNPKKINKISKNSLNTVKDYIKKNPESAKDISDNITNALKYSKLQNKDRESLILLENTIARTTEPKVEKIEPKAKKIIPNSAISEEKINEDMTNRMEKINKTEAARSAKIVEKEMIKNFDIDSFTTIIKDSKESADIVKFNLESKNNKVKDIINKIQIGNTDNEEIIAKKTKLVGLLNSGDLKGFQTEVYGEKRVNNEEFTKFGADGKLGKQTLSMVERYLEENIKTTKTKAAKLVPNDVDIPDLTPRDTKKDYITAEKQKTPVTQLGPKTGSAPVYEGDQPSEKTNIDSKNDDKNNYNNHIESDLDIKKMKIRKVEKSLEKILKTDKISFEGSRSLDVILGGAIDGKTLNNKDKYIFVKWPIKKSMNVARLGLQQRENKLKDENKIGNNILNSEYSKQNTTLKITEKDGTESLIRIFKKPEIMNTEKINEEKTRQASKEGEVDIAKHIDTSQTTIASSQQDLIEQGKI